MTCVYIEYFKLARLPFALSPDPRFVFRSQEHARALASALSESARPGGCLALIGEAGVGKTLLLETLLETCPGDLLTAQVNYPLASTVEFMQAVLSQLDVASATAGNEDVFRAFSAFLARSYESGRKVLLTVDEAHGLARQVLASVLQLAGCNTPYSGDLRVIICGEPELEGALTAAARERRVPRLCEKIRLSVLSRSEVAPYVEHRLAVAGAQGERIFAAGTYEMIFRCTAGNPRRVNVLCDAAMAIACARNSGAVTLAEIRDAAAELHWTAEIPADRAPPERTVSEASASEHPVTPTRGVKVRGAAARLFVDYNGTPIAQLVLTEGRVSIGRAPGNDLQIVSEFISRHHCRLVTTGEGTMIEDVSSTNGMYVKNHRVRRRWLRDGDVLTIGDHELRYAEPRVHELPLTRSSVGTSGPSPLPNHSSP